jgi:hypothetical protein
MVTAIRAAMEHADDPKISPVVRERLKGMHDFITTVEGWYSQMIHVPPQQIMGLIKLGSKVVSLLNFVGRKDNADKGDG